MDKPSRDKFLNLVADNGFIVIFALWFFFLSLATDTFLTVDNQMTVLRQASIIGVVAIGEALVVLSGAGMDVSVASILGLSGVVTAGALVSFGLPLPLAIFAGVVAGIAIGLINGILVTRVRINGIVVTLGMMYALEGLAFSLTHGKTIFGDSMKNLAPLATAYFLFVPVPVVILFIFYALAFHLLGSTIFGAHLFAVGNNEKASWLAGINVEKVRMYCYLGAGALAGFGGAMQAARMGSATAGMGSEFLFPVLTAVILGGVSLQGGRGKIVNVLIAAVFLTTINNGLVLLNVTLYAQKIISGVILVLALSLDRLRPQVR